MNDAIFANLAARFRVRAMGDAQRLRVAITASDRETVTAIAHALSGTAGTFGFAAIGEHAAALETAVEAGGEPLADAAAPLLTAIEGL